MGSRKQVLIGTAVLFAAVVATLLGIWLWLLVSPIPASTETVAIPNGTMTTFRPEIAAENFAAGIATTLVAVVYISAVAAVLWFMLALAWRAFAYLGHRNREYEQRRTGA